MQTSGEATQVMTLAYDNAQRLTSITDLTPSPAAGTLLQKFQYGYDTSSRRTYVKRDNALGDVYGYDTADQLTSVQYNCTNPDTTPTNPSETTTYNYDSAGNRSSMIDSGTGTTVYTRNADNQYTVAGSKSATYDGRGNLATFNTWTYGYDANNRLLTASNASNTYSRAYDALGRCVKTVTNGTTYFYIYDLAWNTLADYNGSQAESYRYVHGLAPNEIVSRTNGSTTLYYHSDGLGNVTKLTSSTGAVLEQYSYNVYGAVTIKNASGTTISASAYANRFLYTGAEYISAMGAYDMRNRFYLPSIGRFMQTDPIGHSGDAYNIYRYCANNPICLTDPSGLCPMDDPPNVFDGQNYGPGNPDNPTLDNPWPSGINPYDQALDPTAIGNAQSLALSGNRNGGSPTSPYISHYGGPWDPDQDGAGTFMGGSNATIPTGNHDNPLNGNSLAISSNVAKANGLHVGGPVYVNGTYLGNYDDTAPENNTIDVYDPGNVVNNSNWGGTVPGGSTITTH